MSDPFAREARDDIQRLSDGLVSLEVEGADRETVDELFRRAHSLKGTFGMEGHNRASELAHALEDLLDAVRSGEAAPEDEMIDAGLAAVDRLETMVDDIAQSGSAQADPSETVQRLRAAVEHAPRGSTLPESRESTDDSGGVTFTGVDGPSLDPDPATDDSVRFEQSAGDDAPSETEPEPAGVEFEEPEPKSDSESESGAGGMSAEEALEAASEFDDLDTLIEDLDGDDDAFDDLEGGGAFGGGDETPEPAGDAGTEPASAATDAGGRASSAVGTAAGVGGDDEFAEVKAEVDDGVASVDELQSEIDAVSFGEFDDDDEMSIDDLVGLAADDDGSVATGEDAGPAGVEASVQAEPEPGAEPTPNTTEPVESEANAEPEPGAGPEIDELVGDEFGSAFDEPETEPEPADDPDPDGERALREVLDAMGATDASAGSQVSDPQAEERASDAPVESGPEPEVETGSDPESEFRRDSGLAEFESRFDGAFDHEETTVRPSEAASTIEDSPLQTERFRVERAGVGLAAERRPDEVQSLTVDVEYADELLSLAEELSVDLQRLRTVDAPTGGREAALDDLTDVARRIQRTVMDIRLMPLRTATAGLQRVVRDVARETETEARFTASGEDVKLDRSIISRIGDPIVHMVRNAVDHGIESPAERRAAGKPETGTVELRAQRTGENVVIEVADDGAGVDADAVRERAVAEGVVEADEARAMADAEAYDLLFQPGLSTSEEVTETSGRGVGMDVVRDAAQALNGSAEVESEPGEGTLVRLMVPASVAMAEVVFVEAGGEQFGLPRDVVEHVGRTGESALGREGGLLAAETDGRQVDLATALGAGETGSDAAEVRVRTRDGVVALHCDRVLDTREVVITPYDDLLSDIGVVSGTTAAADGRLVNIVDVEGL